VLENVGVCLNFGGNECELKKVDKQCLFFVTQIFPYCISELGGYNLPLPFWENPHILIESINVVNRHNGKN